MHFDAHVHYSGAFGDGFDGVLAACGADKYVLQCIPREKLRSTVPDSLRFKAAHSGRIYVMGSMERSEYILCAESAEKLAESLVRQTKALLLAGCDGIKLLEGKPDLRREFPIPDFDSRAWEAFWALLEEKGAPVTLHLNDPPEFWDAERINPYARSRGWFYGEDTVNNEAQYAQMERVLERHPALRIQLAHMYFLYSEPERLDALLERFPGVRLDLTPGAEIYSGLSAIPDRAQKFFSDHRDRIFFGTDTGSRALLSEKELDPDESAARVALVSRFLETEGPFTLLPDGKYLFGTPPMELCGLGLSDEALDMVYRKNAEAFYGAPKPVAPAADELEHEYSARLARLG